MLLLQVYRTAAQGQQIHLNSLVDLTYHSYSLVPS